MLDFLAEPRVMRLATVSSKGCPHVSSVWFLYKHRLFWVSTAKDRIKVKNISKNPCVSCIIDTDRPPYKGIIVFGKAKLTSRFVEQITMDIVKKYSPQDEMQETFKELMKYPRVLIKIIPDRIIDIMSYKRVNG